MITLEELTAKAESEAETLFPFKGPETAANSCKGGHREAYVKGVVSMFKRVHELEDFARCISDGYDCDSDAHKYDNTAACRCCSAEKILNTNDSNRA